MHLGIRTWHQHITQCRGTTHAMQRGRKEASPLHVCFGAGCFEGFLVRVEFVTSHNALIYGLGVFLSDTDFADSYFHMTLFTEKNI